MQHPTPDTPGTEATPRSRPRRRLAALLLLVATAFGALSAAAPLPARAATVSPGTFWKREWISPLGPCNVVSSTLIANVTLDPASNVFSREYRGRIDQTGEGQLMVHYEKHGGRSGYLTYKECYNKAWYYTYYWKPAKYACFATQYSYLGTVLQRYITTWQQVSNVGKAPCPI